MLRHRHHQTFNPVHRPAGEQGKLSQEPDEDEQLHPFCTPVRIRVPDKGPVLNQAQVAVALRIRNQPAPRPEPSVPLIQVHRPEGQRDRHERGARNIVNPTCRPCSRQSFFLYF